MIFTPACRGISGGGPEPMGKLKLKGKLTLFSILPMLLVTAVVMIVVYFQMSRVGDEEVIAMRESMMESKRQELRNYIELSLSAIEPLREQGRKEDARDALRSMNYGDDGYVFVYEFDGTVVANRPDPSAEGTNRWKLADPNGVVIVQELIAAAKNNGDFVRYDWNKPSANAVKPKLSYADQISEWGWMIGTGFYIDDIDEAVAARRAEVSASIEATMITIAGIAFGLLVVVAGLSSVVAGIMIKPLRNTAQALNDISKGEGDLTQRLAVDTQDEVGDVATGFNGFTGNIQNVVREVKSAVGSLTQSTRQMDAVVGRTHEDANIQKQETDQVAAAIHEMAAAVQQVAGSAAQAAEAAHEADQEAGDGQRIVQDAISSINRLADDVNRAAEVITCLGEDTQAIGSVVNVIQGVAEQTNLLALNAAIEAARAGEQGRGFAVVADEVRTLATRTQQSTEEIHRMIERLQSGARQAVEVMEASQAQSQSTMETAGHANESLGRITRSVGLITEMNTQIASAAEEQTAVADEISQSVQQIADIAERSSKNAGEMSSMSGTMAEIEKRLSELVNRFKV